ncbi:MAG: hypothetical protein HY903_00945 [Deltaproteobacteria bacterium]|nr:hypothetical protein [Deltaproteobacteria bacterium]
MTRLATLSERVRTHVSGPIDVEQARKLHNLLGNYRPSAAEIKELALRFRDRFTKEGAREWAQLWTPQAAHHGKVGGESKDPGLSLVSLRAALGSDSPLPAPRKAATHSDARGTSRVPGVAALLRRTKKPEPPRVRLSVGEAHGFGVTPEMFREAIAAGACNSSVEAVLRELSALPRASTDHIAPRDLETAPKALVEVMELVWAYGGTADPVAERTDEVRVRRDARAAARRMSLAEVRAALPNALLRMAARHRMRANTDLAPLYTVVCEQTLTFFAAEYYAKVTSGAVPSSRYLARLGLSRDAPDAFRKRLQAYAPRPSLTELAALYARAADGKLAARDFYIASGLSKEQLLGLQREQPKLFPRSPDLRERDALPHLSVGGGERDLDELTRVFDRMVIKGGKSVADFCVAMDLRPATWAELRRGRPEFQARQRYTPESIAAIAKKAQAIFTHNPLASLDQIVAEINADKSFVQTHGTVEPQRYMQARRLSKKAFPDLRGGWLRPLRRRVDAILQEAGRRPQSVDELVTLVQKELPEFNRKHAAELRVLSGGDAPTAATRASTTLTRAAIATILKDAPALAPADIRRKLHDQGIEVKSSDIRRLVRTVRPHTVQAGRDMQFERNCYAMRALLQLIIRLSPPGIEYLDLFKRWDAELVRRGIPSMQPTADKVASHGSYYWESEAESPKSHSARLTAELFAEYAAASSKTLTHDAIVSRILADYPTLSRYKLGHYLRLWKASPKAFPALAPYWKRGRIELHGEGSPPKTPRFVGGFKVEQAMLGGLNPDLKELIRLTEAMRIPLRLADLDAVIDDQHGSQPLSQSGFLWVTHQVADIVPLAFALRAIGLSPARATVVGSPYGSNQTVSRTLKDGGFDVRTPPLDPKAYQAAVETAIDDAIAVKRNGNRRIVVLDDGGLVASILHERLAKDPKRWGPIVARFKIVEQTSSGINLAELHGLQVPLIAVARSMSKEAEGEYIGKVVAAKVIQALRRAGRDLKGMKAVVGGYGFIGRHIAAELAAAGAEVTIVERDAHRRAEVPSRFRVGTKAEALKRADLVIGATGDPDEPFMTVADFRLLKDGAVFASASSKRKEGDMEGLEKEASARHELAQDNPLVTLPSAAYKLGKKTITVLGDGWPVNFDGGVESVPPELIALTDAALLAGIVQVCADTGAGGIKTLDAEVDRQILARHRTHVKKGGAAPKIYDPAEWRKDVQALLQRLGA